MRSATTPMPRKTRWPIQCSEASPSVRGGRGIPPGRRGGRRARAPGAEARVAGSRRRGRPAGGGRRTAARPAGRERRWARRAGPTAGAGVAPAGGGPPGRPPRAGGPASPAPPCAAPGGRAGRRCSRGDDHAAPPPPRPVWSLGPPAESQREDAGQRDDPTGGVEGPPCPSRWKIVVASSGATTRARPAKVWATPMVVPSSRGSE